MSYDGLQNLNELSTADPLNGASAAELALAIREIKRVVKNVLLTAHRPDGTLRGIDISSLAAGSVGTDQLIDEAITAVKIADLVITAAKLAANSVTSDKLAEDAVIFGKIAAEAIGTESFRNGTIPLTALAQLVTGAYIQNHASDDAQRAITAAHIKDNAVINRHILDVAIGKLTGGTAGQIAVRGASGWEAVTPAGGLTYDPGTGTFSIQSPVTAAYFGDVKTRGAHGGGTTANTWHTRDLGELEDGRELMTFVGNAFQLAVGDYYFYARCPAAGAVGAHQARLYRDNGDSTNEIPLWGSSESCATGVSNSSIIQGTLQVTDASQFFQIQHWFQNTVASSGMGAAASSLNTPSYANHTEVYTTGYVFKLT